MSDKLGNSGSTRTFSSIGPVGVAGLLGGSFRFDFVVENQGRFRLLDRSKPVPPPPPPSPLFNNGLRSPRVGVFMGLF